MSWLSGYKYRKKIPITGSEGAGTDYQVPLTVYEDTRTVNLEEEQTQADTPVDLYSGYKTRVAQKVTISNRLITKLAFYLIKTGSPTGDITFCIRGTDDGNVVSGLTKVWGDAGDLGSSLPLDKCEVTFDTPATVNEEVYLSCEFSGGDASNKVTTGYEDEDEKASENYAYYDGSWNDEATYDFLYKYTYQGTGEDDGIVELNDLCTDFPNDIRFTDDDGVTELDPFNEDEDDPNADPTHWQIEVKDSLESGTVYFYIYWGKSGAGSGSNGANTFPIFNPGSTVTGWTDVTVTGYQNVDWAVNNGKIRATAGANAGCAFLFCNTQTGIDSYRLHADIIAQDGLTDLNYQQGLAHKTTQAAANAGQARWIDVTGWDRWHLTDEAAGGTASDVDNAFDARATHEYILIRTGNDSKLYVDGALKVTHTKASWLPQYIGLFVYMLTSAHWVDFSNIFVTKYVDPEPVVGTPGSLEVAPGRLVYGGLVNSGLVGGKLIG